LFITAFSAIPRQNAKPNASTGFAPRREIVCRLRAGQAALHRRHRNQAYSGRREIAALQFAAAVSKSAAYGNEWFDMIECGEV
jgi:hypothetical protein